MRVSIEFAHTTLEPRPPIETGELLRSSDLARELGTLLESSGCEISTCVLVDDKRVDRDARDRLAGELLSIVGAWYPVNYFCFERDLASYLDSLIELLISRKRRSVRRSVRSWLEQYGSLPCSADIAIWHLLRMGVLPDSESLLIPTNGWRPYRPADIVVSILPDQVTEYESLASHDFLRYLGHHDVESRVLRMYYPTDMSYTVDVEAIVRALTKEIGAND